jgi:membrane associated rhomboid family serine protease
MLIYRVAEVFSTRFFRKILMTKNVKNWALRRKAVTGPFRSTAFAGTAALAFIAWSIITTNAELAPLYLSAVITLYLGGCFFLARALLRNTKAELSIIVHDGVLSIPRAFLTCHSINLHEIKSVEKYGTFAVLIGRLRKSPILVEQKNFESADAFETFVQFLTQFSTNNHCSKAVEEMQIVMARRGANGAALMSVLALSLLATYAASVSSSIEQISTDAVLLGGLNKQSSVQGELYRIASSFFLHFSPFHLGLNILSLAIVGQRIEALMGRVRLINILFASAVTGSLLSFSFSSYETVIGASGGILGLFGAYFFICITSQQRLPASVSVSVKTISLVLILQILSDLMSEGVDIFSHIGGFVFGFIYARLTLHRYMAVNATVFSFIELFAAVGLTLAYISGLIYFFYQYLGFR